MKEEEVLEWLVHQKSSDEIEDVSDVILEDMIDSTHFLAVLFCELIQLILLQFESN